jgi:hypothetical protein
MTIPHEPWLVALSIAMAIQGSVVGFSLARELDSAEGFRRRLALARSALTLATGVWSMRFVGILAANFTSAVDYMVLPTQRRTGCANLVSHLRNCGRHWRLRRARFRAAGLSRRLGRAGDGAGHQPYGARANAKLYANAKL